MVSRLIRVKLSNNLNTILWFDVCHESFDWPRIYDVFGCCPAPLSNSNAISHEIEMICMVRIGIYCDIDSQLSRSPDIDILQIQSLRIGIDFNDGVGPCGR